MTPIKVGDYTVTETDRCTYMVTREATSSDLPGYVVGCGVGVSVWMAEYDTLPMTLRRAAELAGIERQRVEVYRYPPFIGGYGHALMTNSPNGLDYFETFDRTDIDELTECGDMAHEYARARYAALGGAA